jgi:hypothetical protein
MGRPKKYKDIEDDQKTESSKLNEAINGEEEEKSENPESVQVKEVNKKDLKHIPSKYHKFL